MEFHKRGSFPLVTGYIHNENFDLLPGTFTDDTSLTLCLAQSLVDKGFDVKDQVSKYLNWYEHGYMSGSFSHHFVLISCITNSSLAKQHLGNAMLRPNREQRLEAAST